MERAHNTFFASLDYSLPKCIEREMKKHGDRQMAVYCEDRYHSIWDWSTRPAID